MATPDAAPALWSVIPFAGLLLAIALGPVLASHAWHRLYPSIATGLGGLVAGYYLFELKRPEALVHVGFEYLTFISLLSCLYLCAGGIVVRLGLTGTPRSNLALLLAGALISNLIGTTGASLLLIRPWLTMNQGRLRPYHVVFFIIFVSNIGGSLTPIGDPPLLLGYLRGIDFFHFPLLTGLPWLTALGLLSMIFLVVDGRNRSVAVTASGPVLRMLGGRNIVLLLLGVACIFLDPAQLPWLPAIEYHGIRFSFVRELLLIAIGVAGLKLARTEHHRENDFLLGPIQEVAILFVGIFLTMLPALELIRAAATSGNLFGVALTPAVYWFGTGVFSAVLDNAPTYIAFLAGLEGQTGLSVPDLGHSPDPVVVASLSAATAASVFWGAMTYIGNGPNFMVKAIVESAKDGQGAPLVAVPDFAAYTVRYTVPILLPVLIIVGVLFYAGHPPATRVAVGSATVAAVR